MRLLINFLLLINLFIEICLSKDKTSNCRGKTTCSECIQSNLECNWCSSEMFTSERCDIKTNLLNRNCKSIVDETTKFKLIRNLSLSEVSGEQEQNVNQIQPQEMYFKLRKKKSEKFKIKYRQVIDYPVDLYYLMDLSYTMRDDKATLANLGNTLANQMKEITKDFKLGFGSFVDKIMMPYVNTLPSSLKSPCAGCASPYAFRNHMSLSNNTELFAKEVKNSQISGNLDGPEGGMDAIVQAIVCQKTIGWRPKARKLLVYTSDATFHIAGDGRLAGIYLQNDLKCHLDDHGYYNKSNYQDYPSINQISQIVKKHKVNIIFAVTASKLETYKELSKLIEGSSTAVLNSDSSNVVDLIKEEYKKITSSITFKDNSTNNFKLTYRSACLGDQIMKTQLCKGLRVGAEVEFEVDLELINCPIIIDSSETKKEIIKISPVGLQDGLIMHVDLACNCECEKEANFIRNDQVCSKGNGHLKCGICECSNDYYGKSCECKFDDSFDLTILNDNRLNRGCYKTLNDTKVCSGNGKCSCNTCFCDEPFTGKHCECDPFNCERFNNQLCSGHGNCNCGRCDCESKWIGNACQCLKSNETCLDPFNGQLCNDHGDCICGRCKCYENDDRLFSGKYCQKCSNCIDHFCQAFNKIIENQILNKIDLLQEANYTSFLVLNFDMINNRTSTNSEDDDQFETCEFLGNNSCAYIYKYKQNKVGQLILYSIKHGKCQGKIDIKKTTASIVIGILISGIIALIIWKLITYWYDKREFRMFEQQIQNLNWELNTENPLYKPSRISFHNPAYPNRERIQINFRTKR